MIYDKLNEYEQFIYYVFSEEIDNELEPEYIMNMIHNYFDFIYDDFIKKNTKYKLIKIWIRQVILDDLACVLIDNDYEINAEYIIKRMNYLNRENKWWLE